MTGLDEPGSDVCTPVITPDPMVTVGSFPVDTAAAELWKRRVKPTIIEKSDKDILAKEGVLRLERLGHHGSISTSLYRSA